MTCVGRLGSLVGQSKEYPTPLNKTSDGFPSDVCFVFSTNT